VTAVTTDMLDIVCPRCRSATRQRFYGPCPTCRDQLRAMFVSEGRVVELAEYEPKVNVTPNAVALKDD
jgi:hypothetical protein